MLHVIWKEMMIYIRWLLLHTPYNWQITIQRIIFCKRSTAERHVKVWFIKAKCDIQEK